MQRARIIGPKNEKTATGAIFVRMCDISRHVENSLSEHPVTLRPRGLINAHLHDMLTLP